MLPKSEFMKRKQIQRKIIKLCYHLGIYIDIEFFPSVDKVYHRISHKPSQKQIAELEKICSAVSAGNDHIYYNHLLQKFIPEWDLQIENAAFLGKGQWSGFNSYRKTEIKGSHQFEKLFDSEDISLKKILWLQDHFFPLLSSQIKTPKILQFYEGKILSLVYFEFINAPAIEEKQGEERAIEISKILYQLSLQEKAYDLPLPDYLRNFKNHSRYKWWHEKAIDDLNNQGISTHILEEEIGNGRKVFTHGDLKDLNLFEDGSLIDWDEFGCYPAGLEQAFIYSRNILHYNQVERSPLDWLTTHFKSVIIAEEWELFETSFCYFLSIFSFEQLKEDKYSAIRKELLQTLKR